MTEKEQTIDVNDGENATDVVGKAYGLFVMENGNHKFDHNGDHMQEQKFVHFWSTGYWNNSAEMILLCMGVHALISFMSIRGVAFCIIHILIIVAWVHGMTGLWLHLQ